MNARLALIVDDSRSARFALRKQLEHHAFKVEAVESARAAYQWLAAQTPDLIFLDHVMPGEDGFEALRHIKADPRTAAIPVVICSSNEGGSFVAEARSQGAADVLQKPPSPEQLQRVLQQLEAVLATPIAKTAVAAANTQTGGSVPDRVASPAVAQTPAVVTRAPSPDRDDRIAGLMARLAALEQRHSADLAALEARLAAAEQRHSADLAALNARLTALEQRHNADLAALEAQHKTLEAFKKAYEQDCETLRRHFDTALEAGIRRAREQASADIRATLLRALRSAE